MGGSDLGSESGRVLLHVLGPLEVEVGGVAVAVTRGAQRRVLALLATAPGRAITTERLIDRLWDGAPPSSAKTALQTHVSAVRRLLPAGSIVTKGRGYVLDPVVVDVDATRFEELAGAARSALDAGRWHDALVAIDRSLDSWRGEPFADLPDDETANLIRVRLTEIHGALREGRAEALVAIGRVDEALPELEQLVRSEPLRERTWELLALTRWRSGRTAEALRAIQDARSALAEAGLAPGTGLRDTERAILADDSAPAPRIRLPNPITSFVGRATERVEVVKHLMAHRLVTITGVGGAGKSRLAIEAAREVFEAGAVNEGWFVELASVAGDDQVVPAVAAAVGVVDDGRPVETALVDHLAGSTALIVLDNCEHVAHDAARLVRTLLEAAPRIRVLATSRMTMGLVGELVYELPPLDAGADHRATEDPMSLDAVRLFLDRISLARAGSAVAEPDLAVIVGLCRALDGLPLAIELAAARSRTLSLATIAERAGDRLRLLRGSDPTVPERQRTIEAMIAWSYDLLGLGDQRVLARMGVFRSPVDLATIEAICGGDGLDVEAALDRLVGHSLVTVRPEDETFRYELLWTIRDYAWARAHELGEAERTRRAHLAHFTALADDRSAGRRTALTRLDLGAGVPVEDVQAALGTARELDDRPAIMLLAGLLGGIADLSGRWTEALEWFDLALTGDAGQEEALAIRLLRSTVLYHRDEQESLQEVVAVIDELHDGLTSALRVVAEMHAGHIHLMSVQHPIESSLPYLRSAVAGAVEIGRDDLALRARSVLATSLAWNGDDAEALAETDALVAQARAEGDPVDLLRMLDRAIGVVLLTAERRRGGARAWAEEALALAADLAGGGPLPLDWLPFALMQTGDLDGAARSIEYQLGASIIEHLEPGIDFIAWHGVNAHIAWFAGDLDLAEEHLAPLRGQVHPRWAHDFYPMAARVALLRGEHERVDQLVAEYVALDVDASEQPHKLAVLEVHVQALVDRALDGDREAASAARATVATMREMLAASPVKRTGSLQVEKLSTWLALAEAELARLDPDPSVAASAWRAVVDVPDFPWFRAYAAQRVAEAEARGQ